MKADGRTGRQSDRQDEANSLFRNFANAPIKEKHSRNYQKCVTFYKMNKNYLNQVMFPYFLYSLIFPLSMPSSAQKKKAEKFIILPQTS